MNTKRLMKGLTIRIAAMLLTILLCATGALAEPLVGGWENVSHEAAKLPEDAQAAFDKATEGLEGSEYVPVALLSTQVVSGMNYCFLCQIIPANSDAGSTWALVYIYAAPGGSAEITNVYELYIDRHSTPVE